MDGLANKVAIITGASAGIGEATAVLFSKLGCKVVITGRDNESLQRVSEACEKASPKKFKNLVFLGDNTGDGYNEKLINETVKVFGSIDILINNAGTLIISNILSESFEKTYDYVTNMNS
ncbi:Short-chain dehydrogenease/reductase 2-like protein [Leptotrombidium deliense]|uniref:Short-chain dehydrogenease/reductase 2-like protein n=1 Tax=Leptotrombidium deliense TaxID=299467 RepID=A0A443SJM1_9ACAR|nr:Short-chain dehydrogenease/reductase 2-like protein [Leptotrombidium deliense]